MLPECIADLLDTVFRNVSSEIESLELAARCLTSTALWRAPRPYDSFPGAGRVSPVTWLDEHSTLGYPFVNSPSLSRLAARPRAHSNLPPLPSRPSATAGSSTSTLQEARRSEGHSRTVLSGVRPRRVSNPFLVILGLATQRSSSTRRTSRLRNMAGPSHIWAIFSANSPVSGRFELAIASS